MGRISFQHLNIYFQKGIIIAQIINLIKIYINIIISVIIISKNINKTKIFKSNKIKKNSNSKNTFSDKKRVQQPLY